MEAILSHSFVLPNIKPFSVNSSYVPTAQGFYKSSGANEHAIQIFNILNRPENQSKLEELRLKFDPKLHAYKVEMTAYWPAEEYLTKKGIMSNRTIDCSNFEKGIIDCFFLPKFHERCFPDGCPNLNIDDRYVYQLISQKLPANKRQIDVIISIEHQPLATKILITCPE